MVSIPLRLIPDQRLIDAFNLVSNHASNGFGRLFALARSPRSTLQPIVGLENLSRECLLLFGSRSVNYALRLLFLPFFKHKRSSWFDSGEKRSFSCFPFALNVLDLH